MKTSKSELTYLILSIILIILGGGVYVFFNNHYANMINSAKTSALTFSSSTTDEKDLETKANSLIAEAKSHPTAEAITNAQATIDKLSDGKTKSDLQTQLTAISTEMTNENNAETAVKTAEGEQTSANVDAAQATIDVLTNQTVKSQLQDRLDAVANAISVATNNTTYGNYNTYSNSNATNANTYDN